MKSKELKFVITFHTTTSAMAFENACKKRFIPGRLIPVPGEITAGCGLAWASNPEQRSSLDNLRQEEKIEISGMYELFI